MNTAVNGLYIVPGVTDFNQEELAMSVINTGETPITVHAEQHMGTCTPFYERPDEQSICVRSIQPDSPEHLDELPSHLQDLFERSAVHLDESQMSSLKSLLIKFKDTFSRNSDDIGRTSITQHKINTGNANPIRQQARRLPFGKRETEKTELKKMIDRGIVEPSNSPWASNIVLATKKDGKVRFCVDYRRLNDVTVKDAYPLPRVDDCLDSLAGSKWFSSMDLNSGFWQIGMSPDDKEKTAFITSLGLYQFTVMPFGLANSPSTFERLMENILRGLQWQECLVYMDDVITPSRTFEDGIIRLEHILERFTHANLKLKPSKCTLFQKEIKFLGHVVSESGITTDPEKISAVRDWPIPTSAKQVRSFLG